MVSYNQILDKLEKHLSKATTKMRRKITIKKLFVIN